MKMWHILKLYFFAVHALHSITAPFINSHFQKNYTKPLFHNFKFAGFCVKTPTQVACNSQLQEKGGECDGQLQKCHQNHGSKYSISREIQLLHQLIDRTNTLIQL